MKCCDRKPTRNRFFLPCFASTVRSKVIASAGFSDLRSSVASPIRGDGGQMISRLQSVSVALSAFEAQGGTLKFLDDVDDDTTIQPPLNL
jgi:hypothetical protein